MWRRAGVCYFILYTRHAAFSYHTSYLAAYQLSSAANFAYTLLSNTAYPMSYAASVSSSGVSYSARMALYSAE